MPTTVFPESLDTAIRLAVAALVGLAVGIERQRSGKASGPDAHFAGLRTFLLIGLLGGLSGLFVAYDVPLVGSALIGAGGLLAVGAYVMTARRGTAKALDGTTEAAALMVLALGLLAGTGALRLASGIGAVTVLALAEKQRVHRWVERLDADEMRAALHFAVLALVVLPLLPARIATPVGDLTPRATWMFVLIISALNFAGHVIRRLVGNERGFAVTGALGGVVSSTAVTWSFSRESKDDVALRPSYAVGVIAACTVLFPRVFVVAGMLNPQVALRAAPYLATPFVIGVALSWMFGRATSGRAAEPAEEPRSPLHLAGALRMALAFQVVLLLMQVVRARFGDVGTYSSAALFGFTDVDALTVAMTRSGAAMGPDIAARAIGVGIASNTLLKLGLVLVVGRGAFRVRAAAVLAVMLAALVAAVVLVP
jgi:uncharacterized membrane protein (DUF4010 family)